MVDGSCSPPSENALSKVAARSEWCFFSIFKRGMKGIYQHCGEQHLHRYLAEFDFRYSFREVSDWERAVIALKGISGKRLTYRRIGQTQNA